MEVVLIIVCGACVFGAHYLGYKSGFAKCKKLTFEAIEAWGNERIKEKSIRESMNKLERMTNEYRSERKTKGVS